ncbi:MAG: phage protease [Azoarcus sp.]|jgi:phage I-like protein|nr:phage protease [Azoarcus sp.]
MEQEKPSLRSPLAAHAIDLAAGGTVPEWVHLIPGGTFQGRDGRGPFTLDAQAVLAAFPGNAPLPLDYEHQAIHAPNNGQPAPAAGWIVELASRADGIWGRVEWTERARGYIASREYRFLSPVFDVDRDGRVRQLVAAGLVSLPNLGLTALNSRALTLYGESMSNKTPASLADKLKPMFGLAAAATDADLSAAVDKLATTLASPETQAMRQALALPEGADPVAIIVAAHSRALNVTRAAYDTLAADFARVSAELGALRAQTAGAQVANAVEDAIRAGKIAPAAREAMRAYCEKDPAGFTAMVAALPVILPVGTETSAHSWAGKPPGSGNAAHPLLADAEARRKQSKQE